MPIAVVNPQDWKSGCRLALAREITKSNDKIEKNTQAYFLKLAGKFYESSRVKVYELIARENVNVRNWYSKKDCKFVKLEWIVNFVLRRSVFIVNFEHISHLALVFLLLTLSSQMPAGFFLMFV